MSDKKNTDSIKALAFEILEKAYTPIGSLSCTAYITAEPVSFDERESGKKAELTVGDRWAEQIFDCAWMHITGEVPATAPENFVFLINCGGEGLIYDKNGNIKQSITCKDSDFDKSLGGPVKRVVLNDGLHENGRVDFWIDAAANDLFGKMQCESRLSELCTASLSDEMRALSYDIQVLRDAYACAEDNEYTEKVLSALEALPEKAEDYTQEKSAEIRASLKGLLETANDSPAFEYTAIGHAHLDLAWLWPIRESKRKGARTFSTQIMNIKRYPGYVFGASQAQLYRWVKDCYPSIYAEVLELAKTPYWDVQGATWVEMDSNLIGQESMIRQFYYGKRFFKDEFGQDMQIFWVPDSFGYSCCIPQVMQQAEVPYFLTQKMSWNTVNKFPYHTFNWKGLDGTTVFAHMLPDDTYNGPCDGARAKMGENNYQERAISDKAVMLFGIGDGGAGPGFEHIERMNRLRDLKGLPKIVPGKAMDGFKTLDDKPIAYPTHSGELYLERHQGTYTTRTKNKKFNRKCEIALRNYEMLMCAAKAAGEAVPIDSAELEEIWKEILLYQFHDILPGSSINRVYEESGAHYDMIYSRLESSIKTLLEKLGGGEGVFNFAPFEYEKTMKLGDSWYSIALPAKGAAAVSQAKKITDFSASCTDSSIENSRVRISFKEGTIVSYYDKQLSREFADEKNPMNVFSQYTDEGDCWDIRPVEYQSTKRDAAVSAFKTGTDGARAYAEISFTLGDTVISETISLLDGSNEAVIEIDADVHQHDAMLRVAFPTTVNTKECLFNVPFGHIARKTTELNSVEKAQYEVSGHKFVDLSEKDMGFSVLNDCKYGYRCKGSTIDIDLVRSPKDGPGVNVDQGHNTLTLALLPHAGALGLETYREAYILNNPAVVFSSPEKKLCLPEYKTDNESIIFETVKEPADGNGIIARFYNCSELPQTAKISIAGMKPVETVNILEHTLCTAGDEISLKPFSFVNIRFSAK